MNTNNYKNKGLFCILVCIALFTIACSNSTKLNEINSKNKSRKDEKIIGFIKKTLFLPDFPDRTTSVAGITGGQQPYYLINKQIR